MWRLKLGGVTLFGPNRTLIKEARPSSLVRIGIPSHSGEEKADPDHSIEISALVRVCARQKVPKFYYMYFVYLARHSVFVLQEPWLRVFVPSRSNKVYAWYVDAEMLPPLPVQLTWLSLPSGYFELANSGLILKV